MREQLPIVLIPGLMASPRLYGEQIPQLWRFGPVTIANHTLDDTMAAISRRILATAPPQFALVGLSMGGYIAFEVMRQAAERVAKLALLDTAPQSDTPEQSEIRRAQIEMAEKGRFGEIPDLMFPRLVHQTRHGDESLRQILRLMAEETGPEAFIRQQKAIMSRPDSRPGLSAIHCPTLVMVGDSDLLTPPDRATEIANNIAGSRLIIVADCGHLSTLEQPEQVTKALIEWLQV